MGSASLPAPAGNDALANRGRLALMWPMVATVMLAALLFAPVLTKLAQDWWTIPDAGHGLLLAPLALWLASREGLVPAEERRAAPVLGFGLLLGSVLLRYAGALAAELFTQRLALVGVVIGVVLFHGGLRQLRRWWLPSLLLLLSIPLPALVTNAIALPLQFKASQLGAVLLEWRNVPVRLQGNIIQIPGRQLFVTEACSGLRSLTALLSLGVLAGGLWLRLPISRFVLVAIAIPVAIGINAVRVFLTGFLVMFVDPSLGEGLMHLSEGWLMFVVAFGLLAAAAWVLGRTEDRLSPVGRA